MKLKFSIHYNTVWGESLHVCLTCWHLDGKERYQNIMMQTDDGSLWAVETSLMESRTNPVVALEYVYQVEDSDGKTVRREWSKVPRRFAVDSALNYVFPDAWRDAPLPCHLYTDAYRSITGWTMGQCLNIEKLPMFRKTVIFRVSAPQLEAGQSVGICGSHPAVGDWNPSRYLKMNPMGDGDWILSVNVDAMRHPIEYKYVVVDDESHQIKSWEEGDNRQTGDLNFPDGQVLVLYGEPLRLGEKSWRLAGVAVPVFALRSEQSFGVGDFGDLERMAQWAAKVGIKLIQVLPVWDTTSSHSWTDSHPYNIISAFALHPHYMDICQLGSLSDEEKMTTYYRQQRELNTLKEMDYLAVERVKSNYIDDIFEELGADCLNSEGCKDFVAENEWWLSSYAAFCILRDRYNTSRYTDWQEWAVFDRNQVRTLLEEELKAYNKIIFTQYHLYRQLKNACDKARQLGVTIKGDLPIGVYRDSVETWAHPQLFNMDTQTATPPDMFSPWGQNWGFPTYRWQEETDNHHDISLVEWLKRRLRLMERFFGAVRIDHIIGFFRIWQLPSHAVHATLGHFSPSLPMSEEEIGRFGLPFRKELMTRPFINDRVLDRFFGIHAPYVKEHFLISKPYGLYALRQEFDTQSKVREYMAGKTDENSLWIRDGLYRLIANVLMIEDEQMEGMYHPRYMVYNEPVYEVLGADEKDAFMRLYNNYFYERHNDFWANVALHRLAEILADTRMLVCAEDLGLLPGCVSEVLRTMRILPLEVQSMPKRFGEEFAHLESYPNQSVCTTSTHDMPTLRQWWEENVGRTQRYYVTMMQKQGRAPQHLPAHLAEEIVARHLYSPSMLCVLPLQDWLAMDADLREKDIWTERINAPYDAYNQWKYRMPMNIERLMDASVFNQKVTTMVRRSKR